MFQYTVKTLFFFEYILLSVGYLLTNDYAVLVPGGKPLADETARKYGMLNKGQIGTLTYYFHFVPNFQKRTTSSSYYCNMLRNDSNVAWFEQQELQMRFHRISSYSNMDFIDPLYPEQWFLNAGDGNNMNVIPVWKEGITGKGVVATILDDGLQYNHPDSKF